MLEKSNFSSVVCRELGIDAPAPDLTEWEQMVERIKSADKHVTIGLVGKYVQLHDAYLSVAEALRHAGYALGAEVTSTGSTRRPSRRQTRRIFWVDWTVSLSPAASASGALTA